MKKIIVLLISIIPFISLAQEEIEKNTKASKYEEYTAKTGVRCKFVDVALEEIPLKSSDALHCSVRTILGETGNCYFYCLERPAAQSYDRLTAQIAYEDLVEINKVLSQLKNEVDTDVASKPDYLENKYITEDGLVVGYYVDLNRAMNKYQAHWYIVLNDYSNSIVNIKKAESMFECFTQAQSKIEELKKKYGK